MRILLLLSALMFQGAPATKDADFARWWPQFQAAVAKRDIDAVAQGVTFPLHWENGPIREIQSAADFKLRFDTFFTPEIKKIVATKKPTGSATGPRAIVWKARGNEYGLLFKPEGGTYVLEGLSEGPP